ncbi:MAG: glycosyltransferase family 4 protein [Kiritimatiellae bacterium]|nr:glycosyltransferase family 4 protein [Kiritimatiellia bacterium]
MSAPTRCSLPPRVAQLHTNLSWGGGESQLLALAIRLQARGYFTVLATPPHGALYPRARRAGLRVLALDDTRAARRQLLFDLQEFDLTHLNAHDSDATTLGHWLRRHLGIPLILTRRIASPLRRNPVSRWKYSPRRLEAVIAISGTVREVMVRCGYPVNRIHLAGDGVDVAALARVPQEPPLRAPYGTDFLVGGLGRLSGKKNWIVMVRAAEILARESFPVQWMIAGDGPDHAALADAIRAAGLQGRFHLPGFREDAIRLLRQFDVLCVPSRMEGASVTVREAMAMGIPVVAADAPGVVESLAGHGWTVGRDDPVALAKAIRTALEDPDARAAQARGAQRYARAHYDYEHTLAATLAAYDSTPPR